MVETSFLAYFAGLVEVLRQHYTMPHVDGPHDWTHPERMVNIGKELEPLIPFHWHEFLVAVWLHNLDRAHFYRAHIQELGLAGLCFELLDSSPFDADAKARIVDAVEKHLKLDQPGDSLLLKAVQSADRLDWLGSIGIVGAAYFWTANGVYADPSDPFAPWEKGVPRNFWQDAIRQTEWYAMLPSDEVRAIADRYMPARLSFLRAFAAEVSARHGVQNMVERDLQKALGPDYAKWRL